MPVNALSSLAIIGATFGRSLKLGTTMLRRGVLSAATTPSLANGVVGSGVVVSGMNSESDPTADKGGRDTRYATEVKGGPGKRCGRWQSLERDAGQVAAGAYRVQ